MVQGRNRTPVPAAAATGQPRLPALGRPGLPASGNRGEGRGMSEHNCPPSERCFPPAQTRPGDSSQCTTCPWANCISQDLEVDSTRTSVVKAPVIRNKTPGIVSRRQNITSTVPFNFITSRQLVRVIQGVDCLETVTRREPRGASQGVSIRIGEDEAGSVPVSISRVIRPVIYTDIRPPCPTGRGGATTSPGSFGPR